jgi:hypothetical protein
MKRIIAVDSFLWGGRTFFFFLSVFLPLAAVARRDVVESSYKTLISGFWIVELYGSMRWRGKKIRHPLPDVSGHGPRLNRAGNKKLVNCWRTLGSGFLSWRYGIPHQDHFFLSLFDSSYVCYSGDWTSTMGTKTKKKNKKKLIIKINKN